MLQADEKIHYRDRLRAARYHALEDAECFLSICYTLEELGLKLRREVGDLGKYEHDFCDLYTASGLTEESCSEFMALYTVVRNARNDAMHTGAYARRVTSKAVELCLLLEDAVMATGEPAMLVGHHMVKEAVTVEAWHPVGRARQLMLTHSFSNLPVQIDGAWYLINELGMASHLLGKNRAEKAQALGQTVAEARDALGLSKAVVVQSGDPVQGILKQAPTTSTALWLVLDDQQRLLGVISAFELI